MILMKESVLSLKEKQHNIGIYYIQFAHKY